eukprot:763192-Hanusia_phi.AAC.5
MEGKKLPEIRDSKSLKEALMSLGTEALHEDTLVAAEVSRDLPCCFLSACVLRVLLLSLLLTLLLPRPGWSLTFSLIQLLWVPEEPWESLTPDDIMLEYPNLLSL